MTGIEVARFASVLLLTFLSRAWPRWIMQEPSLSDAVTHLAMVKAIRENHHRVPDIIPCWLPEQRLLYPTFYHWLLSYLSPTALRQFERISGATLDTIHNALTMAVAYQVLSAQGLPGGQIVQGTSLAGLLFAVSPRLIQPGERAFFLNPRPFGGVFVSIGFLGTLWFIWTGTWIGLIVASAAFGIASVSHKFALQVAVFLSLGMSVLVGSAWFLVALAFGLFGALLASRGRALQVWRSQVGYSTLYRKYIAPRLGRVKDTPWTILKNVLEQKRQGGNWEREVARLAFNAEFDWFVQSIWLVPVWYLMAVILSTQVDPPLQIFHLGLWVVGATLIGFVITLEPLRFLGQSSRYLEYAVLPASVLLGWAAVTLPSVRWLNLAVSFVLVSSCAVVSGYYGLSLTLYRRNRNQLLGLESVLHWLGQQMPQVVLCNPMHGLPSAIWSYTNHAVVGWLAQPNDQTNHNWLLDYLCLCPEHHLMLPTDLRLVVQKYDVGLIVCDRSVVHDLDQYTLAFQNHRYSVYQVPESVLATVDG